MGTHYYDDAFEWDTEKAASNWQKHGVSFEHGRQAFKDVFAVEVIDDRADYGEVRINLLGMYEGVVLHVTYTERGENQRIISARRASRDERVYYYEQNAS
jgi:uncharacterized DUF497 family protein